MSLTLQTLTHTSLTALASASLIVLGIAPVTAEAQMRSPDSAVAVGPQKLVDKAASVVGEMERDPRLRNLMHQAVGLYIVPEYGRAGFIIGGHGGAGVVVAHDTDGRWSAPVFVNSGGLSVGLQIGAAGGSVAYLLMSRRAVDAFRGSDKFALSAHAGLAVVKYSDAVRASTLTGDDAIMWSNIKGAYAGATIAASDIGIDGKRMKQYYGREVPAGAVLSGAVRAPGAGALDRALPR